MCDAWVNYSLTGPNYLVWKFPEADEEEQTSKFYYGGTTTRVALGPGQHSLNTHYFYFWQMLE